MQINRALTVVAFAALFALAGCGGAAPRAGERQPTPPPPAPAPAPLPPRRPAPVAPPAVAVTAPDWRDAPLANGDWTWGVRPSGSVARFGGAGQPPIALIACDRAGGVVRIALAGDGAQAPAPRPARITTSTSIADAVATPQTVDGLGALAITLPVSSRVLDAMAFSRGRFRVEVTGTAPVILPSWSEVGRVVEDCRG